MSIDYLMLDNSLEDTYKEVKEILNRKTVKINLLTRIGDLQTLKNIESICRHSSGVELAMNYFCKQLSFMEVYKIIT
jgi:pyruvate kinase